jgi:Rod binding domain-containing protein
MLPIGAHTDAARPGGAVPQPRLVKAAHEFEAQMMSELLKPLAGSGSLTGGETGEDQDTGSGGALGQFASEALGRALSEHGGFGIANRIVCDLSHAGSRSAGTTVTGRPHSDTLVKSHE